MKETLLSEIKEDVVGETLLANEGISENADPLITKSIRTSIAGNIKGLRVNETAFERYVTNDIERLDCFVLGSMTKSEYARLKQMVTNNLVSVSSEVAKAVQQRQADFFDKSRKPATENLEQ